MPEVVYNDLREYIDECKKIDHWREINDAD
jgi:hypothetical protein